LEVVGFTGTQGQVPLSSYSAGSASAGPWILVYVEGFLQPWIGW
jgi:hypothetical protein